MKLRKVLILSAIALGLIAISLFSVQYALRVKAQSDLVTDLTRRLSDVGVPVKEVKGIALESLSPYCVAITIQRIGGESERGSDEMWLDQLTRREAEFSYKYGYKIDCYSIRTLDSDGIEVGLTTTFLSPTNTSQSPYPFNSSEPDDEFVKKLVLERIKTFGLSVDSVEVKTGIGSSPDVQLVLINLTATDRQVASQAIPRLVPSIRPIIQEINQQPGARIAMVWVKLVDGDKKSIMGYLWDLELSVERGGTAEGITGWFTPPPAAEEYLPTSTQPTGGEEPTQTDQPYP